MSAIYTPANGPEDWKQFLAEPNRQWKDRYSAKELATCRQNAAGFPLNIQRIFNQSNIPLFNKIEFLISIPEYKMPLPGGSQPSQNDIFVLAKGNGQLISINHALMLVHSFSETDQWFDDYADFAFLFKTDVNVNGVFSAGYINGINLYLWWVKEWG